MKKLFVFFVAVFGFLLCNTNVAAITTNLTNELKDNSYTTLEVGSGMDCDLEDCFLEMTKHDKIILNLNQDYNLGTVSSLYDLEVPSNVTSLIIKSNSTDVRTIKGVRLFANGAKFYLDETVVFDTSNIYGGSKSRDINGSTYLEIHGDVVKAENIDTIVGFIYGGGYNTDVGGDTKVILTDNIFNLAYVYGGGHAVSTNNTVNEANVNGTTNVIVDDHIFYYKNSSSKNLRGIYGGGRAEGIGASVKVANTYVESPITVTISSNIGASDTFGLFAGGHALEGGYAEVTDLAKVYVPSYESDMNDSTYQDGNDIYAGGGAYNTLGVVTKSIVNKAIIDIDGWVGSGGGAAEGVSAGGAASGENSYVLVSDSTLNVNKSAYIVGTRGVMGGGIATNEGYSEVASSVINYAGKTLVSKYYGYETAGVYGGGISFNSGSTSIVKSSKVIFDETAVATNFYGGGIGIGGTVRVDNVDASICGTILTGVFAGAVTGTGTVSATVGESSVSLGNTTFGKVGSTGFGLVYNIGYASSNTADVTITKANPIKILDGSTLTINTIFSDPSIPFPVSLEFSGNVSATNFKLNLKNIDEKIYGTYRPFIQTDYSNDVLVNANIEIVNSNDYSAYVRQASLLGMDIKEAILYETITLVDNATGIKLVGSSIDLTDATLKVTADKNVDLSSLNKDIGVEYVVKVIDKNNNEVTNFTLPYKLYIPTSNYDNEKIYEDNSLVNNFVSDNYYVFKGNGAISDYIVAGDVAKVPETFDGIYTSVIILIISIFSFLLLYRLVLKNNN